MRVSGALPFAPYRVLLISPRLMCSAAGVFTTICSTVSPSSWMTALWPAIRLPAAGSESALVMPAARVTFRTSLRGLTASSTRSSGWTGSLYSVESTVICSAGISTKPSSSPASIMPGITTLPRASITCAPAGTWTPAPTAVILPFSITTVPSSITPCVTVRMRPPVMAIAACARATGRARALRVTAAIRASLGVMDVSSISSRCRVRLGDQRCRTILPGQEAVLLRVHQLAVDEHLVGLGGELERVAGPDGQVSVFARLDRADAPVDGEDARRIDSHGLECGLVGHPVVVDDGRLLDVVAFLDDGIVGVQADQHAFLPEQVGVLGNRVPALDFEAPGVGKGHHANVPAGDLRRDHVGVERVVEGRNLKVELVGDAEQRVKVVHLVGMDVQPHPARQHLGQRFQLQVALGRRALLAAVLPRFPLGGVVLGVEQPLADHRSLAHQGRRRLSLVAVDALLILAPRPLHAGRRAGQLDFVQRLPAVQIGRAS